MPEPPPYARVIIDRGQSQPEYELTYAIPADLRATALPGCAVLVPLGRQQVTGYLVGYSDTLDIDPTRLRSLEGVLGHGRLFDDMALRLARWMSAYYHCTLSEALGLWVPQGWQVATQRRYRWEGTAEDLAALDRTPRQASVARLLAEQSGPLSAVQIQRRLPSEGQPAHFGQAVKGALDKLVERGLVAEIQDLGAPAVKPRSLPVLEAIPGVSVQDFQQLTTRAPRQAAALQALQEAGTAVPVADLVQAGFERGALTGLERKGLVRRSIKSLMRAPLPPTQARSTPFQLNEEQAAAAQHLRGLFDQAATSADKDPLVALLYGITASGKTEVYLQVIEHCLQAGRRAMVLVPEIALTAQTVDIFRRRFGEQVAILHSALALGERFDEWRRIRAGQARIVVGARSAVFAPLRNVGLIVVDEEHDHSYKQDSQPRYHTRDVVLKRAGMEHALVVLGSATPSLESYRRALDGRYQLLRMRRRIATRPLPEVEVVDLTAEATMGKIPVLGRRLQEELRATVQRGEQAIIFLNRRGFATYVQCLGCGHVERCPHCDITLTYHLARRELACHHCGHTAPVIESCPQCQGWMLGFTGMGTEKVEGEVLGILQAAGLAGKVLRLDRDTTQRKGSHSQILGEFRRGAAQVLIGTQMVTKGLDFPHVTLVGVISADVALNVPDFRAAERTFQLLAQVAGRAGRGEQPGKVVVQTLAPDHYAIQAAADHDYDEFARQELEFRQSPAYPPFSNLVNIVAQDEDEGIARARIVNLAAKLQIAIAEAGGRTELLGPVACPLTRVSGKFRFHLMLRDANRPRLHQMLQVFDQLPRDTRQHFTLDVDPMSIL